MTTQEPLRVALIGAGVMGAYHAETLAKRLPDARLVTIVDPFEAGARRLIERLGRPDVRWEPDLDCLMADNSIDAVAIASPGGDHPAHIQAVAEAGKHIFCEKPIGWAIEPVDRALTAVERAGVFLQIGFQRRFDPGFRRAHDLREQGALGEVQLLRSLTRDPELTNAEKVASWAIFRETMIHDFDILRWLSGSEPVEVYALADALVAPQYRDRGLLDTAAVTVRFANGALATADASLQAVYGYDVRAEVFGSEGMVTVGEGRLDTAWHYSRSGVTRPQANWFLDLFGAAYTAELAHFVECVRTGTPPAVTGADGRAALRMALAAIESVETGRPVRLG